MEYPVRYCIPLAVNRHVEIFLPEMPDDADWEIIMATLRHAVNMREINNNRPEKPQDYQI